MSVVKLGLMKNANDVKIQEIERIPFREKTNSISTKKTIAKKKRVIKFFAFRAYYNIICVK